MLSRNITALTICLAAITSMAMAQSPTNPLDKKLIEYGWDVPTPAFIHEHIQDMTKRPFDGLVFRLEKGCQVLEPTATPEADLQPDLDHLAAIEWGPFTDNFIIMYSASSQDWFDDVQWTAIEHNVTLVARAARIAKCVGVCFDPEPYGTDPWRYADAAHKDAKTFAEYEAQVRIRGAQFIKAIQQELPKAQILTFFQLTFLGGELVPMDPPMRAKRLGPHHYGLLPAFLEGMLDAINPGVKIIDGNETAYYYTDRIGHFEAYHMIHERARALISPDRWDAYREHVDAGQALYMDQYFGLRQEKVLGHVMTPEERPLWCEHNTYWSLYTTDRYVWCYSERMNWWTNTDIPPGCEDALRSARAKIANQQPLGIDLAPIVAAAHARE